MCVRPWAPPPLVVGEGDALGGHLEVDHGGGGQGVGGQGPGGGLLHRLDPRQGLHLHGAQEPHVTGWGVTEAEEQV